MNILVLLPVSVGSTPAGWEGVPCLRWAKMGVLASRTVSTGTGMGLGLPFSSLTGVIFPASHVPFSDTDHDGLGEILSPNLTSLVEVTAVFVLFGWSGAVIP